MSFTMCTTSCGLRHGGGQMQGRSSLRCCRRAALQGGRASSLCNTFAHLVPWQGQLANTHTHALIKTQPTLNTADPFLLHSGPSPLQRLQPHLTPIQKSEPPAAPAVCGLLPVPQSQRCAAQLRPRQGQSRAAKLGALQQELRCCCWPLCCSAEVAPVLQSLLLLGWCSLQAV